MSRIPLPPELLPGGRYPLRVVRATQTTSRAGNPVLRVLFEVINGPNTGHRLSRSYSLLPQAIWRLCKLIAAARIVPLDGHLDTSRLVNASIEAIVIPYHTPNGPPLYDIEDEKPLSSPPT